MRTIGYQAYWIGLIVADAGRRKCLSKSLARQLIRNARDLAMRHWS